MAGRHHGLDGHESEWTLGVGDGQGGLACCDSWGCKESDTTERLNWTDSHGSLNIPGLLKTQFIIVGWLEHILILNGLKMPFYVILGNFLANRCWKVAPGRVEYNGRSQTLQSDVASGGWTLNQAFQSTLGSSGDQRRQLRSSLAHSWDGLRFHPKGGKMQPSQALQISECQLDDLRPEIVFQ